MPKNVGGHRTWAFSSFSILSPNIFRFISCLFFFLFRTGGSIQCLRVNKGALRKDIEEESHLFCSPLKSRLEFHVYWYTSGPCFTDFFTFPKCSSSSIASDHIQRNPLWRIFVFSKIGIPYIKRVLWLHHRNQQNITLEKWRIIEERETYFNKKKKRKKRELEKLLCELQSRQTKHQLIYLRNIFPYFFFFREWRTSHHST